MNQITHDGYLTVIRQRIAELERQVEQQRSIVVQLEANRSSDESVKIAREVLQTMEQILHRKILHERQFSETLRG